MNYETHCSHNWLTVQLNNALNCFGTFRTMYQYLFYLIPMLRLPVETHQMSTVLQSGRVSSQVAYTHCGSGREGWRQTDRGRGGGEVGRTSWLHRSELDWKDCWRPLAPDGVIRVVVCCLWNYASGVAGCNLRPPPSSTIPDHVDEWLPLRRPAAPQENHGLCRLGRAQLAPAGSGQTRYVTASTGRRI